MYKIFIIIAILTMNYLFANETKINLTPEETEYLKNKKEIKMCADPSWMPFEKIQDGKHIGLAADYMQLLSKRIDTPMTIVPVSSWKESIEKAKNRECDIYTMASKTSNRQKYMNFTTPYIETPIVIATKKGNKYISDIKSVQDKRLGIVKGYSIIELYKKQYPNINIVEVDSINDGLLKVERGEIFGYIDNSIVITQAIQKEFIGIIEISGKFDTKLKFGVATRNDEKELLSVFNKAINSINEKTKTKILNNWVGIDNNIRKETVKLTPKETEYIKNNTFTFAGDPNWLPFEAFDKQGKYIGIVSEHIDIIEKKLKIKFKKIVTKDWSETLELSNNTKADIISGDAADVVLAKNYQPIDTYMQNPLVMVTRDDYLFISNLNHMKDKKIAYIDGYGYTADIVKKYPNIDFIKTSSMNTALLGVKSGEYDIFIGTLSMVDYTIINMGIEGIKISGDTGITMNLTLFINKNKPQLYTIINKAICSIDDITKTKMVSKWRHSSKGEVDNTLVWQIIGIFFIIFIIGTTFVVILRKKVKQEIEKNRKKDQQLLQQSRLAQMGEMISMIAHQWRQPLAAISATSNAITLKAKLNKLDNDVAIELSKNIAEYSQHLSSTIDDFREFFKSNKEKKETTYDELIQSVLGIVGISLENQNINIIKQLKSKVIFNTYPNELKQVILNLIKNAEDVLLERKIKNPTITITTKDNILSISDNGGGVPEDIIGKIFDPYFSTKTKKDGTGLGLYMSKTIIEEHCGGKLSVSNNEYGAEFAIELKGDI